MTKKKPSFIIPYLIEPNGKVKKFLDIARKPDVRREYQELLTELKSNPKEFGKKLRTATWSKKSLDDILEELESGKSK